jgi:hypothetical protein
MEPVVLLLPPIQVHSLVWAVAEIEAAQSVNASARQSVIQRPRLAGRLDD